MAEGGGAPKQVIHIHIHNTSNEETIIQEQHVGDRTEIHDSDIGSVSSVIAGQHGQDCAQISQNIRIFLDKSLSKHALVFEGEQISGVFGTLPIAVKLVSPAETGIAEARILLKLNVNPHSHIISLIDSDWYSDGFSDYVYIALEKCHIDTIRQFLLNRKDQKIPFDLNLMLKFCKQLNCGIEYIHENNIIHKDLKPDNVFLSLDQSKVKIADFGMSQEIESKSSKVHNSGYFGTDGYRAPETFGGAAISQKTDIFSLGIIHHFLLSNGEHPFGNEPYDWNYNVKQNTGIDLSQLLVLNKKTMQHLIKCSIEHELDCRPTIWEVEAHPCWEGKEVDCNFDYRSENYPTKECAPSEDNVKLSRDDRKQYLKFLEEMKRLGLTTKPRMEDQKSCAVNFEQPDPTSTTDRDPHPIATEETKSDSEKDSQTKIVSEITGQAMSDEERKKKITLLSERISALLEKSEHLKASKLLEELASLQSIKELETSLQMAECFLHLEKLREARETIDAVRDVIVTLHALNANDVFKLGCDLCEKFSYVRAIILLRIASDLYKTNAPSADDAVNGIYRCMEKTGIATKPLIKAGGRFRVIGLDFGAEYMAQMFDCLSDVENAEPGNKTLKQALSLHGIEVNYHLANKNEKRLKPLQTGIEILENQFGSNASKYRLYGTLLHNTGTAYEVLGKFSDAEKYYVKSIEAKQKATDYADESEKQSLIEITKSGLKSISEKLGKI